jgi:hypothetical protein
MPPGTTFPAPSTFLGIAFVASLFASPWINSLAGFGEEWGWRGFLLPRLLPLGKWKAYLLVGIIWGLWHAPLVVVGFNYPGYPLLGILLMCGFTFSSGIFINELSLKYRSAVLAGWIHGLINCQGYGIWRLLFFNTNPILGGMAGLVGMIGWLALGMWSAHWSDPANKGSNTGS